MRTQSELAQDLKQLLITDSRLLLISKMAGEIVPRSRPPGFEGLARIICGQQISVQSADAIWARLAERQGTSSAEAFLSLGEDGVFGVGLSRTKYIYIHTAAQAIVSGDLDLDVVATLPAKQAIDTLVRHKGIGRWTAEVYLMFCAGHPDVFPIGDLALRKAVTEALNLQDLLKAAELEGLADRWAPYRSTAALLFWQFYSATRRRQGLPL